MGVINLQKYENPYDKLRKIYTGLENVIKGSTLTSTRIFRPPYGRIKKSQIKAIKRQNPMTEIIMWDVLSGDFDERISKEQCVRNVLRHCKNGSIIVFHDSLKAFRILEYSGYQYYFV